MSLITTKVKIIISGKMISYYETKGYKIPRSLDNRGRLKVRRGTTITVDVNDLPQNSQVAIQLQCDECKKIYNTFYSTYSSMKKENNKTYCQKCASIIYNSGENAFWKNKKFSQEHKKHLSESKIGKYKGENNPYWNPNLTSDDRENRRLIDGYTEFVKKVLHRDNYKCQCCNSTVDLKVHHLNGYNWYKEGRLEPNNAITLCQNCHSNFHYKYGKGNNTKEQFNEWFNENKIFVQNEKSSYLFPTTKKIYCVEEDKIYDSAIILAKEWNLKNNSQIYDACNRKIMNKTRTLKDGTVISYSYTKSKVKGKTLCWI